MQIPIPIQKQLARLARGIVFIGDFASFAEARRHCSHAAGFEAPGVLDGVLDRTRRIRAVCEAGGAGCAMGTVEILAACSLIFLRGRPASFRVLDFGGSLGNHFFRLRKALGAELDLRWDVCETPALAAAGRRHMQVPGLRFLDSLDAAAGEPYDLVLAIGSLQCTDDPPAWFDRLAALGSGHLCLGFVPFIPGERDRLTLQRPPHRTTFDYPSWFFGEEGWKARFARAGYRPRLRWDLPGETLWLGARRTGYAGLVLERIATANAPETHAC